MQGGHGQRKCQGKNIFFKVRELPGNFEIFGNLSGNFRIFVTVREI